MASRQSWRYTEQEQRLTGERWPQRCKHDGEVADHEEERRAQRVPGGIRHQDLVNWVCKEKTELGQALM